ncbi:hypothetical protein [Micromonospora chersina]|uniref:hypothetical protein n=1 Tax=Micromonospora chersina TaxID=47854 RepID=UPI0037135D5C
MAAAGWADRAPSATERKAQVIRDLDQANADQRARAPKTTKGPRPAVPGRLAPSPNAWDEGVFETQEAPIPSGIIKVTSRWGQTNGDVHHSVYAGSSAVDPDQGLLVVRTYAVTGEVRDTATYPAPAGTGPLRIVAAAGHRLRLSTGAGAALVFDVDTRRFG